MTNIKRKTLEELENNKWGAPTYNSHLVTTCHRLRKIPIGDFSTEDLRIMLGQSIGVKYLMPLALDILRKDPLSEGDFYPGDLFVAVLRLKNEIKKEHLDWLDDLKSIIQSLKVVPKEIEEDLRKFQSSEK